jgi:hypothetical protein
MKTDVLHPLPPDVLTEPAPAMPRRAVSEESAETPPPTTDPPTLPPS